MAAQLPYNIHADVKETLRVTVRASIEHTIHFQIEWGLVLHLERHFQEPFTFSLLKASVTQSAKTAVEAFDQKSAWLDRRGGRASLRIRIGSRGDVDFSAVRCHTTRETARDGWTRGCSPVGSRTIQHPLLHVPCNCIQSWL
jgi:hypothetical protein